MHPLTYAKCCQKCFCFLSWEIKINQSSTAPHWDRTLSAFIWLISQAPSNSVHLQKKKKKCDKVCEQIKGKSALGHEVVHATWDMVGTTIMKVWSFNMPKGTGEGKTPIWVMANRNWKAQSDLGSMHVNGLLLHVFHRKKNILNIITCMGTGSILWTADSRKTKHKKIIFFVVCIDTDMLL